MTRFSLSSLLMRTLKFLRRNSRGAAIIEFAVTAPFLIALMIGTIDLSLGYATKARMHSALARTIELAQIGSNTGDFGYLKTEGAAAAGVPESNVTVTKWLECNTTTKAFDDSCGDGEQIARYITVTISKTYDPVFSAKLFGEATGDGLVPLSVSDSLRIQ